MLWYFTYYSKILDWSDQSFENNVCGIFLKYNDAEETLATRYLQCLAGIVFIDLLQIERSIICDRPHSRRITNAGQSRYSISIKLLIHIWFISKALRIILHKICLSSLFWSFNSFLIKFFFLSLFFSMYTWHTHTHMYTYMYTYVHLRFVFLFNS